MSDIEEYLIDICGWINPIINKYHDGQEQYVIAIVNNKVISKLSVNDNILIVEYLNGEVDKIEFIIEDDDIFIKNELIDICDKIQVYGNMEWHR